MKKEAKKGNPFAAAHSMRGGAGGGPHKNRELATRKGACRKVKHKKGFDRSDG